MKRMTQNLCAGVWLLVSSLWLWISECLRSGKEYAFILYTINPAETYHLILPESTVVTPSGDVVVVNGKAHKVVNR